MTKIIILMLDCYYLKIIMELDIWKLAFNLNLVSDNASYTFLTPLLIYIVIYIYYLNKSLK